MLTSWQDVKCQHFYGKSYPNITLTKDDIECLHGRRSSFVVIDDQYKLVYIENRKAASETIRMAMKNILGTQEKKCGIRNVSKSCSSFGRCTSSCLLESQYKNYFYFSFVRDPIEKFLSGLQVYIERKHPIIKNYTTYVLSAINSDRKIIGCTDQHVFSQATHLSAPFKNSNKMIPINFIGRTSHLVEDFTNMLFLLNKTTTIPQSVFSNFTEHLNKTYNKKLQSVIRKNLNHTRTTFVEKQIRQAFEQDVKCFT
tara:strand:+ start:738 stop:1502 length:765 start_codon:yes stop_codon:yes gene_type:complete